MTEKRTHKCLLDTPVLPYGACRYSAYHIIQLPLCLAVNMIENKFIHKSKKFDTTKTNNSRGGCKPNGGKILVRCLNFTVPPIKT